MRSAGFSPEEFHREEKNPGSRRRLMLEDIVYTTDIRVGNPPGQEQLVP